MSEKLISFESLKDTANIIAASFKLSAENIELLQRNISHELKVMRAAKAFIEAADVLTKDGLLNKESIHSALNIAAQYSDPEVACLEMTVDGVKPVAETDTFDNVDDLIIKGVHPTRPNLALFKGYAFKANDNMTGVVPEFYFIADVTEIEQSVDVHVLSTETDSQVYMNQMMADLIAS